MKYVNGKRVHALQSMVSGMNLGLKNKFTLVLICETCIEEQQLRSGFFNDRGRRADWSIEIAHSDVFGYMKDVEFKADSTSNESNLKMLSSGRNETFMVVEVTESSKSPSLDFGEDIEKREEQVEDNLATFQAPRERPTNKWCSSTPPPQNNSNEGM